MESIFLQRMFDFAQKAGEMAMRCMNDQQYGLKKDQSVITKADQGISQMGREALADFLKDPAHILVDEEDPQAATYLDQKRLDKTPFIWSLDPIDGTRLYANAMPLFGISLGLIKDLKPWLGVVYFPALNEMFYADGTNAYFVQEPFSAHPRKTLIVPIDEQPSAKSLFFCNDGFFNKHQWDDRSFHVMIVGCAVVNLCWPTIGRGMGCFLRSNLWDFAGSWPILRAAGMDFRSMKDGKVLDRVHEDFFNKTTKPWELKDFHMISSQRNYSQIKSKIVIMPA